MRRWILMIVGCLTVSTSVAFWQTTPPRRERTDRADAVPRNDVNRYAPRQVLPNPIRPITEPPIVEAGKAELLPNELVLGVELNGVARAYSINQLTGPQREIINDVLGETAIAATW